MGALARVLEAASMVGAAVLVIWHAVRFLERAPDVLAWWTPIVVVAALAGADLLSGVVHWLADTWGSESLSIVGPRFIRPFRVHHLNPDDFLDRRFIDANGDVATLTLPVLLGALAVPLDSNAGRILALFLVSLCASALPTNQAHQWAHRPTAPRLVVRLQRVGLLLGPRAHARHHQPPYTTNYCILTGWCNRPLAAIGFFPALERAITALTGLRPRSDSDTHPGSAAAARPAGGTGALT